ncbi:hypothetical protein L873DRAFT_593882 [Choiromyces venosus 120613-1]|uniref:Uncharacterized protein n=1 Tax=Choiromyces venosus 120613-1 TaxID=1336337 RepID=A0A3N4JXE0_9PEZI|nr:hypothetical protein L873DRAFT_593882 [Choiromyces venosus 120613-1]
MKEKKKCNIEKERKKGRTKQITTRREEKKKNIMKRLKKKKKKGGYKEKMSFRKREQEKNEKEIKLPTSTHENLAFGKAAKKLNRKIDKGKWIKVQ